MKMLSITTKTLKNKMTSQKDKMTSQKDKMTSFVENDSQ
tara:strand:- start:471 stop:587 length:117 start_codon:yes stop_codon:yes gene_type:complete